MKRTVGALFFLMVLGSLSAESVRVKSLVLFENPRFISVESEKNWVRAQGNIPEALFNLPQPQNGGKRKWRIRALYSGSDENFQTALQIRLNLGHILSPIFTFPWVEQKDGRKIENRSNWFIPRDSLLEVPASGSNINIRLIAPPGARVHLKVYKIILEVWDNYEDGNFYEKGGLEYSAKRAGVRGGLFTDKEVKPDANRALLFSLEFIKNYLSSDFENFYKDISNPVYSLKDGRPYSKSRLGLPAIENVYTLKDYLSRYETHVYPYNEYIKLFPSWIDPERNWKPGENDFLFMGSSLRPGAKAIPAAKLLVFMVRFEKGRWKVIARPVL